MEARWWPEIQLTEQGPGPQAACCIGFGRRAGASVERSSLIWLDCRLSCVRDFGGRYATNEGWMNKL